MPILLWSKRHYVLHIFCTFANDMGQVATTLDEQIELLTQRGMTIVDIEKAKEVLYDVGYYRLGFYWHPFEIKRNDGLHQFKNGSSFDDAVKLYYFDYELRNLLIKYITRIEVKFRTLLVYIVSNKYKKVPTWFVSPKVVNDSFIATFDSKVYTAKFKSTKVIAAHHKKYINDRYAPAWKTIEFMTLGSNIALYKALLDIDLKKSISSEFGINYTNVFENYMDVVLCVRNACAHGSVLYDIPLYPLVRKGPAGVNGNENYKLNGAIKVIRYMLGCVSTNRVNDFDRELSQVVAKYSITPETKKILTTISGF